MGQLTRRNLCALSTTWMKLRGRKALQVAYNGSVHTISGTYSKESAEFSRYNSVRFVARFSCTCLLVIGYLRWRNRHDERILVYRNLHGFTVSYSGRLSRKTMA